MKTISILSVSAAVLLVGCTEKTEVALKVTRDKVENRLVGFAGEVEVIEELGLNQYAALKERLVRLKTTQKLLLDKIDTAIAKGDFASQERYISQVKVLNEKIPFAEAALHDYYESFQVQRNYLKSLRDEAASYQTIGMLSENADVQSDYNKRRDLILKMTENMKSKAKRAQTLLEVNSFEETYTTR